MILFILSIIAVLGRTITSMIKQHKTEFAAFKVGNYIQKKGRLKRLIEVEESIKEAAEIFGLDTDGTDIDRRDLLAMANQVKGLVCEKYEEVRAFVSKSRLSRPSINATIRSASHCVTRLIQSFNRPLQVAFIRQVQLGGETDEEPSHIR